MVLEKALDSPLDCKDRKSILILIGRTDAEAPIFWPPDVKNWLIEKDPEAGKDWRQEKKGMTEDEMIGWHHRLNGHELEQVLGVGDGQGSLECCSPWGHKESDTTEKLNWTPESDIWTCWISIHSPKSNGQWHTWTNTLYPSPVNMSLPPMNTAPVSLVHSICGHFPLFKEYPLLFC